MNKLQKNVLGAVVVSVGLLALLCPDRAVARSRLSDAVANDAIALDAVIKAGCIDDPKKTKSLLDKSEKDYDAAEAFDIDNVGFAALFDLKTDIHIVAALPPCSDSFFVQRLAENWTGSASTTLTRVSTKFTSPTDTLRVTANIPTFDVGAQLDFGPVFVNGQLSFGGVAPSGNFSDIFQVGSFTGKVNTVTFNREKVNVGFRAYSGPGFSLSGFAGYWRQELNVAGTIDGVSPLIEFQAQNSRWSGARVGAQGQFSLGNGAFLDVTAVALPFVQFQNGTLTGNNGSGWDARVALSAPITPGYSFYVFAQDTFINVSGTTSGPFPQPIDVRNNTFSAGVGLVTTFDEINRARGLKYDPITGERRL